MDRIGVRMVAAEIRQRRGIHHTARGRPQDLLEQPPAIGPGDRAHGVEAEAETAGEEVGDGVEIEDAAHQQGVVLDRIDHLDGQVAVNLRAKAAEIDVRPRKALVGYHPSGLGVDRVREPLRRRPAVLAVELDAEIPLRPARIVAGRKDQATLGPMLADQMRGRGCGENTVAADQQPPDPVPGRQLNDGLDRPIVEVPAVAAHHQRLPGQARHRPEHRRHEILEIMRGHEHPDLLAQAGRAGLLPGDRPCLDGLDHARTSTAERPRRPFLGA